MSVKDYYAILELSPSATLPEIKRAYRKLALQFHPDKSNNDPYSTAQFEIIKEAYEVLSDTRKKDYYLQQRWYKQSTGKKFTKNEPLTPPTILKQALELNKYLTTLDQHRMDQQGLHDHLVSIISDDAITVLNQFNDLDINKEIVHAILKSARLLPHQLNTEVQRRSRKINMDAATRNWIDQYTSYQQKTQRWEKNKIWLILLIVVLISLIIFIVGK